MDDATSKLDRYDGGDSALIWWLKSRTSYKFDADERECFFCGANAGAMSTGVLPVVGAVWKCRGCQPKYDDIKKDLK